MRCDNSLPDPHPDGASLGEDCDRVSPPVQQIWRRDALRHAIGQRRRPAQSPARSPPLSTTSESHRPNSYASLMIDGANSSAFNSAGIDLRQSEHQGHIAPSHKGKVKGDLQALHTSSAGPWRGKEGRGWGGAHPSASRLFGSEFLNGRNEGAKRPSAWRPWER